MKLVKSLLLGSAAGIVAVGSAVAADLPVRKAAPVDYVQVCSAFGTGYFYIPGTDTCLKVGGYVRYEARMNHTKWSVDSSSDGAGGIDFERTAGRTGDATFSQFARGAINFDARTATEFGTLRSYIMILSETGGETSLDEGFIEFAGFTFGRKGSFFRGYGGPQLNGGFWQGSGTRNLAGYTVDGGAFSVSLSAEAPRNTFVEDEGTLNNDDDDVVGYGFESATVNMPDFVLAGSFAGNGFSAHLAGAITQIRSDFLDVADADLDGTIPGTTYGYALTAGASFDILSTTKFTIQGAYSVGAHGYLGLTQAGNRFTLPVSDAYILDNGSVKKTEGWTLTANLNHAWTPTISQDVYGGYGQYKAPGALRSTFDVNDTVGAFTGTPNSFDTWALGTKVTWAPVAGLAVVGDVNYVETTAKNRIFINEVASGPVTTKTDDAWTATLRVQRSF